MGAREGDAAGKAGSCESDAAGSEEESADMNDTMTVPSLALHCLILVKS